MKIFKFNNTFTKIKISNKKRIKNDNKKRIIRVNKYHIIYIISLVILLSNISFIYGAADPTLVTKVNSALKKIQGYLVKISLPAAGVAIASGVLIRKFSFGSEEKMVMGKKIIINAILGYAIILSIDLILKFVDALI